MLQKGSAARASETVRPWQSLSHRTGLWKGLWKGICLVRASLLRAERGRAARGAALCGLAARILPAAHVFYFRLCCLFAAGAFHAITDILDGLVQSASELRELVRTLDEKECDEGCNEQMFRIHGVPASLGAWPIF